jgi:hypothetical protein
MNKLFFWKDWELSHKLFYSLLFLFLTVLMGVYLFVYSQGVISNVVDWEVQSNLETYQMIADEFSKGFFSFSMDLDTYLIIQKYIPSTIQIKPLTTHIFLGVFLFSFLLIITVATYLNRLWYTATMVMLLLFLSLAKFDVLSVPADSVYQGDPNQLFFFATLLAFFPLSFFFQSFKKNTPFFLRFILFGLITGGFVYWIDSGYSQVENPAFFITQYSILIPIVLSVLFIGFISHEIVNSFLFLTTVNNNGLTGKNSLVHFAVISAIYLLNVIYAYLVNINYASGDFFHLNPFVILVITSILGVWGFRKRDVQYGSFLPFAPYGAYLYLGMATITFSTIAYAFATGNDSLIEVFEDVILYTHFAFGLIFILYVGFNFGEVFHRNQAVHKVVWQGKQMTYVWTSFFSFLIMFALLSVQSFFMQNQLYSAYYIGLGDAYLEEGHKELAKKYYSQSLNYDYQNHRGNYMMADLIRHNKNKSDDYNHLDLALRRSPTPYSYVRLAEYFSKYQTDYKAMITLKKGIEKFPKSGELYTNLALLLIKDNELDKEFLEKVLANSVKYSQNKKIASSNWLAILTMLNLDTNPEELFKSTALESDAATVNNELVYWNRLRKLSTHRFDSLLIQDTVLQQAELCYVYNYALNQGENVSDTVMNTIQKLEKVDQNSLYSVYLKLAQANVLYKKGDVRGAYILLEKLNEEDRGVNPQYPKLLGSWLLEQGDYRNAIRYFNRARMGGKFETDLSRAVALSEINHPQAIDLWTAWDTLTNHPYQEISQNMLKILVKDSLDTQKIAKLTDNDKYSYLHYHNSTLDNVAFEEIRNQIKDTNFKVWANADRLLYYVEIKDLVSAKKLYLANGNIKDLSLEVENLWYKNALLFCHASQNWEEMQAILPKFKAGRYYDGWKAFFTGVHHVYAGNPTKSEAFLEQANRSLPFEMVIYRELIAHYNSTKQEDKAYNFILESLGMLPESVEMYDFYILQALYLGYESYAERGMEDLQSRISQEKYKELAVKYDSLIALSGESWE